MNKIGSIVVLLFFCIGSFAQNKTLENIEKYLEANKIEKAKAEFDKEIYSELKETPEAYLLGIRIYFEIFKSKETDIRKLDRNADKKIISFLNAYNKFAGKNENQYIQLVHTIKSEVLSRAEKSVSLSRKKSAQEELIFLHNLNQIEGINDVDLIFNIAMLATDNNDLLTAITFFEKLVDNNYPDPEIYLRLNELYTKTNTPENREKIFELGRKRFPENQPIAFNEINYYMGQGKVEKLLEVLQFLIDHNTEKSLYRFTLANLYENLNEFVKAEKEYMLALKEDPQYLDAAFYLGNMYLNQAISTSEDATSTDGFYSKSAMYLEKAYQLDPANQEVLSSLKQLYSLTGQFEKYEKMKTELEKL